MSDHARQVMARIPGGDRAASDVANDVQFMRDSGLTFLECMKIVVAVTGCTIGQAKRLVHESPAWADERFEREVETERLVDALAAVGAELSLKFGAPVGPWVMVAKADDRMVREWISALASRGSVVRYLESGNMVDEAGLFSEFAAKMEFPEYFGHNWYALVDCLDDLHGAGHGGQAVAVVTGAADVLVDKDHFPVLVVMLCEAAERANLSLDADGLPRSRPPFPLHFVFLIERFDLGFVAERLRVREDLLVTEDGDRLLVHWQSD